MISIIISLPFLLSSISKSIDSGYFLRQLSRIGAVPQSITPLFAIFSLGLLWFIGLSFLFQTCMAISIVLAQGFLCIAICMTAVQWWRQKRPSCECYGPGIVVSPMQSILIDGILLLALPFVSKSPCTHNTLTPILMGVLFGLILARISSRKPLLDLSPTAIGKKWTFTEISSLPICIAFISPKCNLCQQWIPILYALRKHHFVQILSYMKPEDIPSSITYHQKKREQLLGFVEQFPTILWIEEGKICKRWNSTPPQNLLEEIRSTH